MGPLFEYLHFKEKLADGNSWETLFLSWASISSNDSIAFCAQGELLAQQGNDLGR